MYFFELLLLLLILYVFIRPLYLGFLFARPRRLRIAFFTPTNLGVTYEEITLTSPDGVELAGWYIPSRNQAAVILLHGHSANRLAVVHQAEALVKAGYGVLMLDLRAHGSSGGRRFARSQAEVDDLLTAVAYLSKRPDVNAAGIGLMGVSVGGLFALQAAAQTVAVRAVALDGPSPAASADLPPPPSIWARLGARQQQLSLQAARWFVRHEPLPPNVEAVQRLGKRPIFIIAAGQGSEAAQARRLAAAAEMADVWQIPEARHAQGWQERPDEYSHRLVTFFDSALVRQNSSRIILPRLPEVLPPEETVEATAVAVAYEATVPMQWANLMALAMVPLAFGLFWLPYSRLWGSWPFISFFELSLNGVLVLILIFFLSVTLHELLHAAGFWLAGRAPLEQIQFGFSWVGFAPFAHCRAPMRASAYRLAVLLPGLVLGIVPGILGVGLQQPLLVMWATLMLLAAGGDAAVLWAVRRVPGQVNVLDHPQKVGCQILQE